MNNQRMLATDDPQAAAEAALEQETTPTDVILAADPVTSMAIDLYIDSESAVPLHEQHLFQLSGDEQETMANLIYGEDSRPLSDFTGKDITVLGMFIFEQKPYRAKAAPHDWQPGYFQVRFVIIDKERKGEPWQVVHTSSKGVFQHAVHILNNRGWFLFEEPQEYRVSQGKNNTQHIYNLRHDRTRGVKK